MPNQIFFDIETGGFSGRNNPVLSIAWASDQEAIQERFARPTPGTSVSRWSERKVWEPIRRSGRHLFREQEILMEFLSVLENAPENTQLVGWNIGYVAAEQGKTGAAGFDIQMLMSRARQFNLEKRYAKALRKIEIRDIGAEWALRIAKSIAGTTKGYHLMKEGVLHPDLFQEAVGYVKQASKLSNQWGITNEQELAERLSRENIRFSGWKQEMVHDILFPTKGYGAHQAGEDVAALREIMHKGGEVDEKFLRRWSTLALENKLVSRIKYTPSPAEAIPERFTSIMTEAQEWGVREGVEQKLRTIALESDIPWKSVVSGKGIPVRERMIGTTKVAEAASVAGRQKAAKVVDLVVPFLREHRGKIALGAGAAALVMLKPGAMFSGSDDEYNVIEGLPHGGEAERMRKLFTDFGSGFKGARFVPLPKSIRSLVKDAPAQVLKKANVEEYLTSRLIVTKGKIQKGVTEGTISQARADIMIRELEGPGMDIVESFSQKVVERTQGEYAMLINPSLLKQQATARGVPVKQYVRGTYFHESFHKALAESGRAPELLKKTSVPKVFKKQLEAAYATQGRKLGQEELAEEFLAHSITSSYTGETMGTMFSKDIFKTGRDRVSQLEVELGQQFLAGNKNLSGSQKAQMISTQVIEGHVGAIAQQNRKNLTDFGSPANLSKAAHRAEKMVKGTQLVNKFTSSILEPGRQKLRRKTMMRLVHREGQRRASSNALRPGKRHRHKTGGLVL